MSKSFYTIHEFKNATINNLAADAVDSGVVNVTSTTRTLTSANSGFLVVLSHTTGTAITLPVATSGLSYRIVVGVQGQHTVVAPSALLHGGFVTRDIIQTAGNAASTNGTAGTTITLSGTSGSRVGDTVSLVSDGAKWFVSGTVTTYNGATIA